MAQVASILSVDSTKGCILLLWSTVTDPLSPPSDQAVEQEPSRAACDACLSLHLGRPLQNICVYRELLSSLIVFVAAWQRLPPTVCQSVRVGCLNVVDLWFVRVGGFAGLRNGWLKHSTYRPRLVPSATIGQVSFALFHGIGQRATILLHCHYNP